MIMTYEEKMALLESIHLEIDAKKPKDESMDDDFDITPFDKNHLRYIETYTVSLDKPEYNSENMRVDSE